MTDQVGMFVSPLALLDWWVGSLDGWTVCAGVLCAIASSLLGCFLVLRRMSLLGDAISHAVLPGLAAAFLISGSRNSLWMFAGAVVVGVFTAVLSDWIHHRGQVDEGASMGVVFTTLFAIGLLMIVVAADRVDLDPGCVLYGAIEQTPLDLWELPFSIVGVTHVPRVVVMLSAVFLLNLSFVLLFFKELKISTFDPALSTASGYPAWLIHYLLMTLVAITAVASFESVGNILVVAMLVVPASTAYLLTQRLSIMVALACLIGGFSAFSGHVAAVEIPGWFGFDSTTTAGMMSVVTGIFFTFALLFSPRQGWIPRIARQQWLRWSILADDVLGLLYRLEERVDEVQGTDGSPTISQATEAGLLLAPVEQDSQTAIDWVAETLLTNRYAAKLALRYHQLRRRVVPRNPSIEDGLNLSTDQCLPRLTHEGRIEAESIVRSHRLWEQYLVTKLDVADERLHQAAHKLEHFTDSDMQQQLDEQTDSPPTDPHGRRIPSSAE